MIQVEFSIPIRSAMVIRVLTISNLFCFYFIWGEMITEAHFNLVTQLKKLVNSISQPVGLIVQSAQSSNQIALSDKTKV